MLSDEYQASLTIVVRVMHVNSYCPPYCSHTHSAQLHDMYGTATADIFASLSAGIRTLDPGPALIHTRTVLLETLQQGMSSMLYRIPGTE